MGFMLNDLSASWRVDIDSKRDGVVFVVKSDGKVSQENVAQDVLR
jgi:hypothetical protein